ncbi:MAG: hypothetical protein GF418_04035 [Chitinivibrionales bacterium]|nr:hypothetical protein [Chitinivibrionales bacterium]
MWVGLWCAGIAFWLLLAYRLDSLSQTTEGIELEKDTILSGAGFAGSGAADTAADSARGRARKNPEAGASDCINVNTADAASLVALHGIGPVIAERIVSHREEHGTYARAGDLMKVKGIGPKKVEKIKADICF